MNPRLWRVAPVVALSLLALPALAKKKEDPLDRMVPVPADQPIPVIDFFRPPLFSNPELNPAGTHFAAIVSSESDRLDLIAFDLATKKAERLTGGGNYDINTYEWLNDKRLLFNLTQDKLYSTGLFAVELGRFSQSYVLQRYNVIVPVGFPKSNPLEAIIWIKNSAMDQGADGGVIKIDTRRSFDSKDGLLFMNGDDGIRADIVETYPSPKGGVPLGYLADRKGEMAYAVTTKDGVPAFHRYVDKKWEPSAVDFNETPVLGIGDEPGELLTLGPRKAGTPRGLYRLDAVTGKRGELLVQDDKYDFVGGRFYRHPVDNRLLGVQYQRKGPQSVWFDPAYQRIQAAMENAFPGEAVRILGSDREEKQFFVSVSSDVHPASYFHVKVATKTFVPIANIAPWIDPKRMRPMQTVTYKARDGREIEGYVTLPDGASKENKVPLVVLPHGGPWVRDNWGWDAQVQFLASRGYAVFQPNYRGSTGYAWKFPEADIWDFRKMHDDVTDGVKTVLKTRLIDPDRIAIMGGSFGGYLALSGAAYEKDLYRCAITIAGVFDWERVMKDARGSEYLRGTYGSLRRHLGDPAKRKEKFEEISPIKHVDQVKIPVFVAHGTEDHVAEVTQSKALIAELKKYGVPYEKQFESGEGHGFHKLDNQVQLYTAIEAFLAKNMAPRKAAEVATAPASAAKDDAMPSPAAR
ncbi:MAG: S9 family peptidase [Nibricoccus sp.]